MANNKIYRGFEVAAAEPIDRRTKVSTYSDLSNIESPYDGLEVYVDDEDAYYKYNEGSWTIRATGSGGSSTYVSSVPAGTTLPNDFGGISAGTPVEDLSGRSISAIFDDALFPTIEPTKNDESLNSILTPGSPTLVEVGNTISRDLTGNFNQGTIESKDGTADVNLVGAANEYEFSGPGISPAVTQGSSLYSFTYTPTTDGQLTWTIVVDYLEATGSYFDSKGNASTIFDTQRGPGSINDTVSLEVIYPYYWGTSASDPTLDSSLVLSGNKELSKSTGTITIDFATSSEYLWFAVPDSAFSGFAKSSWFITALNNGSIGGSSNLFASSVTVNVNGQDYLVYKTNFATTPPSPIELRN